MPLAKKIENLLDIILPPYKLKRNVVAAVSQEQEDITFSDEEEEISEDSVDFD